MQKDVIDGLIFKISRLLIELLSKYPIKKWASNLNRHFSEEGRIVNRCMKRYSTLLFPR